MKAREKKNALKRELESIIYSSVILSSILIVLGLLLVILREYVVNYINYIFIFALAQNVLFNAYLFVKFKKKYLLPFLIVSIVIVILFIILNIVNPGKIINIIAVIMGISSAIKAIEGVVEMHSKDILKRPIDKIIEVITTLAHAFFAVELFVTLGDSVPTHLIIYGVVFMVHGIEAIVKIIVENIKIKKELDKESKSLD